MAQGYAHHPQPPSSYNPLTPITAHDHEYRRALKDWESYVTTLTDKIMAADPTIPELPFKDVNFRIYRDIRFSNDPTPYKVTCHSRPSPLSLASFPCVLATAMTQPTLPPYRDRSVLHSHSMLTASPAALLGRLLPHRPQGPLRLLLRARRARRRQLRGRRPVAPRQRDPAAPAREHRRAPAAVAARAE